MPRTEHVVIAGTYHQFNYWCREVNADPRRQMYIGDLQDTWKLRGSRYSIDQFVFYGTYYENSQWPQLSIELYEYFIMNQVSDSDIPGMVYEAAHAERARQAYGPVTIGNRHIIGDQAERLRMQGALELETMRIQMLGYIAGGPPVRAVFDEAAVHHWDPGPEFYDESTRGVLIEEILGEEDGPC